MTKLSADERAQEYASVIAQIHNNPVRLRWATVMLRCGASIDNMTLTTSRAVILVDLSRTDPDAFEVARQYSAALISSGENLDASLKLFVLEFLEGRREVVKPKHRPKAITEYSYALIYAATRKLMAEFPKLNLEGVKNDQHYIFEVLANALNAKGVLTNSKTAVDEKFVKALYLHEKYQAIRDLTKPRKKSGT